MTKKKIKQRSKFQYFLIGLISFCIVVLFLPCYVIGLGCYASYLELKKIYNQIAKFGGYK